MSQATKIMHQSHHRSFLSRKYSWQVGYLVFLTLIFANLFCRPINAVVFSPKHFTLPNGMQVVIVTNRNAPVVSHMVWYEVGAADEPAGQSGLAHLLEHLMFKGTKLVPNGQFSKIVARNGGIDNAFTSHDYTAFFQMVSREKLELVMKLEADRMRNLALNEKQILLERDVVLEERATRTDNSPAAQLYEAKQATLYINHPYRNPIIGWRHEIKELSSKQLLQFYNRFYVPNNAILVVSGDVSIAELRPLAKKYYGVIPRGPKIIRKRLREPPHNAPRRVTLVSARAGQSQLTRTYIAPSYRTAQGIEAYALEILADILGGGTRSRLFRKLVINASIAASVMAYYDPNAYDFGEFNIFVSPRSGASLKTLELAVNQEIQFILEQGVTKEEVKRSVRALVTSAVFARDSVSAAPNIIGRALTTGQTIADIEAWPERLQKVKVKDVLDAAKKVLRSRNSVTSILKSSKDG